MLIRDESNSITDDEALHMSTIIKKVLMDMGIPVKEIYFVGSRVRGNAHKRSDLDVVVIPKYRVWNNAVKYTAMMNNVITRFKHIKYKGNNIELQIHPFFSEIESGFNYIKIQNGKLTKVIEGV